MDYRDFGKTGLRVSAIGFGAGHIGEDWRDENDVGLVLNQAIDLGINLIDTARFYGLSEERIGKHISHRRDDYILSTKIGYGIDGVDDWSPEIMAAGIDRALKVCRTDRLDIVHLHSCGVEQLENADMINALLAEKAKGKARFIAYSGENEALDVALELNVFDSIQCSVSIADQKSISHVFHRTNKSGTGVIAKRPVSNMAWRFKERPVGEYAETYWERLREMALEPGDLDWHELALRFALSVPGVHSCIVGTGNPEHLKRNVEIAEKGALPENVHQRVRKRFLEVGERWRGEV